MTNIGFSFRKKNKIGPSGLYLSPKGSNCGGVVDSSTVPTKDPQGEVGGMIRPASSAIATEVESQTESEMEE